MLSTARQGALLAPRLAGSISRLPAESSLQAQARALRPHAGQRGFASAAAYDLQRSNPEKGQSASAGQSGHSTYAPTNPPPITASRWHAVDPTGDKLRAGDRFSRQVPHDPIGALLSIAKMSRADLTTINLRDIRAVLFFIRDNVKSGAIIDIGSVNFDDAGVALTRVTAIIQNASATSTSKQATASARRLIRSLLYAAMVFRARELFFDIWNVKIEDERLGGPSIMDALGVALDVAQLKEWECLARMLSMTAQLPVALWTPKLVELGMKANVVVKRPSVAVELFSILSNTTTDAKGILIQAHLEQGNIEAAQQAVNVATGSNVPIVDLQMSLLRGYRALGHDDRLEERVRASLAHVGAPMAAPILNEFIRLRLADNDLERAKQLLSEFHFFGDGPNGVEPDQTTIALALSLQSKVKGTDISAIDKLWRFAVADPKIVTDQLVAHLCRSLDRLGHFDAVYDMFAAACKGKPSSWDFPAGYRPGIVVANTVLQLALRYQRYEGLVAVAELMREAGIKPNEWTVMEVLKFAKNNLLSSPISLSRLLHQLSTRTNVPMTMGQINVVLAEAVRVALRTPPGDDPKHIERPSSDGPQLMDPNAIALRGELQKLLQTRINTLAEQGQTSGRENLHTRLMYDVVPFRSAAPPQRSIQATWDVFVKRGFRPGERHYRSLMKAYVECDDMIEAERVMDHAAADMVKPSRWMYHLLIRGWAEKGDVKRSRNMYELLRREVGVDSAAVMKMINALALVEPDAAVTLAKREWNTIKLDDSSLASIARAISRTGDSAGAIFFLAHYCWRTGKIPETRPEDVLEDITPTIKFPDLQGPPPLHAKTTSWTKYEETINGTYSNPGFFRLALHTAKEVKHILKWMAKQDSTQTERRDNEAYRLGLRMLGEDDVSRPHRLRRQPELRKFNRKLIVDNFAVKRYGQNSDPFQQFEKPPVASWRDKDDQDLN